MPKEAEVIDDELETKKSNEGEGEKETPEDRGDELEGKKPEAKTEDEVTTEDEKVAKGDTKPEDEKAADEKSEDEKAADEKAKEDEPKNKNLQVPKFRLDAVTAKARAAEEKNEKLQAELDALQADKKTEDAEPTTEQVYDTALEQIDVEIADAMKEGDSKKVSELMAESRSLERKYQSELLAETTTASAASTTAEYQESTRLDAVLSHLEQNYPIFNEESKEYNQEANDSVLELQEAFIAKGQSTSDALINAVNYVLPSLGYTAEETEAATTEAKKTDAKKTDVEKNLDTEKRQPAAMDDKVGADSDSSGKNSEEPNAQDLTEEEFDALPDATKKAMRGDIA